MFLLCGNVIKTSTKGKEIHISEEKLIWLIKQKTLKAILMALEAAIKEISRVKLIEFSFKKTKRRVE